MLIGSRAIAYWNAEFQIRPDSDWDFVGDPQMEEDFRRDFNIPNMDRIEFHDPDFLNNRQMEFMFLYRYENVVTPFGLAIFYRSHLHRDYKWDAQIAKYHKFIVPLLTPAELKLVTTDKLYLERVELTKQQFKAGNPNLLQSNDSFFDDAVEKIYEHDYLHELYAYEERPMFERLKKPENFSLAWCEKDLWNALTEQQKIQCVAEETYVIATERYLVPNNWHFIPKKAYYWALRKVCTTLTSGWFRDYAIDNFPEVYHLYDPNRIDAVRYHLKNRNDVRYHAKEGEQQ